MQNGLKVVFLVDFIPSLLDFYDPYSEGCGVLWNARMAKIPLYYSVTENQSTLFLGEELGDTLSSIPGEGEIFQILPLERIGIIPQT